MGISSVDKKDNVLTIGTRKTINYLATKCVRMMGFDYILRHIEVDRSIHLLLCKKYEFKKTNKIRSHSVQEFVSNDNEEIRVYIRVLTDIKVCHNMPENVAMNKTNKLILFV